MPFVPRQAVPTSHCQKCLGHTTNDIAILTREGLEPSFSIVFTWDTALKKKQLSDT
jgi:hypothetical protein